MTIKKETNTNKSTPPRLLVAIRDEIGPKLQNEFGYSSFMEIPRLSKVIINMGLGEALQNNKAIESATKDLMAITGQKPITTKAKKSIAGFKLREGMPIGAKVTLRGKRMYEFVDRLVNAALPRIRDFQGIPRKCFDGRGNCSIGIKEHTIFPEIDYNSIDKIRGMQIVLVTTAKNDQEGIRFLELAGMPFVKN
jgi:large subunit ribosomal protein L5